MPQLFAEMESLITFLPSLIDTIQNWWLSFLAGIERIPLPISVKGYFVNALDSVGLFIERILTNFMSGIFNYLRYILSFILAPILAFYMLRDKEKIKRKIIALLPVRERNEILRIGSEVDHLLRQFLYGYLLISLIVAVLSYAGLALIGVKYALFLGIFMGIAEMIPYFGPYIGGAPAVVLAYIQSPRLALYALIVLFIVQQLEGMVISPKILGHKTGLHPLVIIFAVLAGGVLFGILGSIFAVPVAATGIFISKYIYSRAVEYREK
jgi:predicted PurR-regulated permease PerM